MRHSADLLVIFGLFILGAALGQIFVLLSLSVWYGLPANGETTANLFNISQLLRHPEGVWVVYYMQAITALSGLGLSGWVYRRFFAKPPVLPLQDKPLRLSQASLVILLVMVLIPFVSWLVWLNVQMRLPAFLSDFEQWAKQKEHSTAEMMNLLTRFPTAWHFWVAVVVVAVIPAICEEYWFRGVLQNKFRDVFSPHVAIWVSGFIFSALHFQFYGFFPRWLLGVLFGYLYYWSGNLWTTIIAHFINNFLTLLAIYLYRLKVLEFNFYEPMPVAWYLLLPSVLGSFGLIYLYYYQLLGNREQLSKGKQ